MNRRYLLMLTQATSGLLALGLGVMTLLGSVNIWYVYGFALLNGIVSAVDSPVRQTFVGEMVPTQSLPNAIGLNSTSFNVARLIGPAIGGYLIAWTGPGWAFIINGLSFAATTISLFFMRSNELHELPTAPREKGQIKEGMAYIRKRSDIIVIMIVVSVVSALGLNNQLTQAQMAIRVFHKPADQYGLLGSIFAIGAVVGALAASRRSRPRVRLVVGAAIGYGIFSGIYCLMPTFYSFAFSGIFVGFFMLTLITAANSTIQISTEPAMRGRVMSLYLLAYMGVTPFGSVFVGWISGAWGARWSIGIGAIASFLVGMWALLFTKHHWHLKLEHEADSITHWNIVHEEKM
jgi:MFS family permease